MGHPGGSWGRTLPDVNSCRTKKVRCNGGATPAVVVSRPVRRHCGRLRRRRFRLPTGPVSGEPIPQSGSVNDTGIMHLGRRATSLAVNLRFYEKYGCMKRRRSIHTVLSNGAEPVSPANLKSR